MLISFGVCLIANHYTVKAVSVSVFSTMISEVKCCEMPVAFEVQV